MSHDDDWNLWEPNTGVEYQHPPSHQQYKQTFTKQANVNPNDVLMDIQSGLAGKIIGKGGVKIKALRKESGAFISVIDGDNYGLKMVKISGDANAKKIAQKLINEIINANDPEQIRQKLQKESESSNNVQPLSTFDWDMLMKEQAEYLKKKLDALPPIFKNFYKEHSEVSMMSDQEVEDFRLSKNNIMVKYIDENNTKPIPKPILKFSHAFKDYPEILEEIQKQKFETPSPVQCQAWPIIMSGYDLIAIAQTGTGKTLAFLLPAFIHLDLQPTPHNERKGPSVLVLAPTRELVLQIESEVSTAFYLFIILKYIPVVFSEFRVLGIIIKIYFDDIKI